MKTTVLSLATLGCVSMSAALMAENLNIPMGFEFLALDGQKVERSLVRHKSDLTLTPGDHEIAIRYSDSAVGDVSDTPEIVKSDPFIVTLNVEAGAEYLLRPAGGEGVLRPFEFAEAPDIEITRTDGATVNYTFTQTDIDQRDFDTMLYGKRIAPAATPATATAATTTTAAAAPDAATTAAATAATATIPPGGPAEEIYELEVAAPPAQPTAVEGGQGASPEQMLRLWWERADEQTRKDFLSWAIKQL